MSRVNKTHTWFGDSYPLSSDEEQDLVDIIQEGLDSDDPLKKSNAQHAINDLVGAYSPLIEKIAREKFPQSGGYGFTYDDFLAESYLVATQCARTFQPNKGKTVIRFSSYVSRAIVSSLGRMSLRSRSVVHVPSTVMADARKWSHVYYDMVNKGITPNDDDVSEISGVKYSSSDMRVVLGATFDHPIEESTDHPSVKDVIKDYDESTIVEDLVDAIRLVYGEDADAIITVLGITTGEASTSPFFLKLANPQFNDDTFFERLPTLLNHPHYKNRLRRAFAVKYNQDWD